MYLMKAQITGKKVVFHELCKGDYQQLTAVYHLVKVKSSKDIFGSSLCKVTVGLKYI